MRVFPTSIPAPTSSAVQTLSILGSPTGGSFTLTTTAPLTAGTTAAIPFTADASTVAAALTNVIGGGNVVVTGGPLPSGSLTLTFQGQDSEQAIPNLTANNSLTGGLNPSIAVATTVIGGVAGAPTIISSVPNSVAALSGNNAVVRVIIDGSNVPSGADDIGFDLDASNCTLRGLAIEGFDVGVSIPETTDTGDLVQGNFIGAYVQYLVNPNTGAPLPAPNAVGVAAPGNHQQGIVIDSTNATIGGTETQDNNVIADNGAQGVLIEPGASGNQVLGNQIGVIGPVQGYYFDGSNGDDGVLVESVGSASDPANIVYTSSNVIGGAVGGAGNVISLNRGAGVHLEGVGATRNLVEANYIGVAPGGGYLFGTGDPGNQDDGVWIDDAPNNQIGGGSSSVGNVISSNGRDGVDITGADALGNRILSNIIGLTAGGGAVLGNHEAGVDDTAPGTVIGPGNVISANLIGVLISSGQAANATVIGNLIGTDSTGEADLGNAEAGIDIESASGVTVEGNGHGSQVISGNQIGVKINGNAAKGNNIEGNLIGVDSAGTADRGNSNEGVLIEEASNNIVGGTTAAARNVISANLWGVRIDGSDASGNVIMGNEIGTDITGTLPLGNEIDGVVISSNASKNIVGGMVASQGNTIAYNVAAGVAVQSGTGDSILSNAIFSNTQIGIDLLVATDPPSGITANQPGVGPGPDNLQNKPVMLSAIGGTTGSAQISLDSLASTRFLIQFFSSPAADPSGYGQGQTFLTSQVLTTSTDGSLKTTVSIAGGFPPNGWITATATNESTGDTSEFSNGVVAQPVSVTFTTSAMLVDSTAGTAVISVQRVGNSNAVVSVAFATADGTGVAGLNYQAASGTLIFGTGQFLSSFSVPILPDDSQTSSTTTVLLSLNPLTDGTTLGLFGTETLSINEIPAPAPPPPPAPTPSPPPPPVDLTTPVVTAERLITSGLSITGVTLTFSKPMDPVRAAELSVYGFYVFSSGYRYTPGSSYTTLSSATYDAASDTVTLRPSAPLPPNTFFEITVDGQSSPLLNNGLTDLSGNQLAGSSGAAGTPLFLTFAVGTKLSYVDSGNNNVTLQLAKGGIMQMFVSPTGVVQELQLVGTVPGRTTLSGSLSRRHRGNGRALVPTIGGAAGVRIRLKTPPFFFGNAPRIDALTR